MGATREETLLRTEDRLRVKGRNLRQMSVQQGDDTVTGEEGLRQLADLLPAGLSPAQTMTILGNYLQALEKAFTDHRKAASQKRRQLEGDCRALNKIGDDQKQELERLTSDLLELTSTLEEQESLLSTANQKVANYEKQFKRLHRENGELANKLAQKENDAIFFRQELDRSIQETEAGASLLATANARIEELERRLVVERENASGHEKEVRRLAVTLSECQNKNAITERKMEEMVVKYNDEIRRLSDRTNADAHHEINLLRKRVRSNAAPEMREYRQLLTDKPTLETASNLKALMQRLLAKLEQAGLDLQ
ncbi:MAG: hypothetical protein FWG97_05435 [Deltaproteobacteria bacterium]|nr:hypothetical protein [Deltaproteobacteria bacterium]